MELTEDDRTFIWELLDNASQKYIRVETDYAASEPTLKHNTLYLPYYDSCYQLFKDVHDVEYFDCNQMDMHCENWTSMFKGCKDLKSVIFPEVDVDYIYAPLLFDGCPNLETLDLSSIVTKEFDACYLVGEDTTLTEVRMPDMVDGKYCIPNKDIRIVMHEEETYEQTLDSMVYGSGQGESPTFVMSQRAFEKLKPTQYEHLGDSYTIEIT